jgi:Phage integrase family
MEPAEVDAHVMYHAPKHRPVPDLPLLPGQWGLAFHPLGIRVLLRTDAGTLKSLYVRRPGGELALYRPLEVFDALFAIFANLRTPGDVLFFIERFGPLTRDGLEADKGELVDGVLVHADAMRELFIFSTGDRARRAHIRPAVQPICRNGSDPRTGCRKRGSQAPPSPHFALATGMRRGEILALRWRNVDLDQGTIRVVESLEQTKAEMRFKAPKTEKPRAITLPTFAVEELHRLRRDQAERLLKLGIRHSGDCLVCGREDGGPMLPTSLTHEFAKVSGRVKDAPRVRFHDLRHSHATQLLLAGVHPKVTQERLGHASITTTLDLYSHVTATMQEDAAAKLDTVFRSAISGCGVDKGRL